MVRKLAFFVLLVVAGCGKKASDDPVSSWSLMTTRA